MRTLLPQLNQTSKPCLLINSDAMPLIRGLYNLCIFLIIFILHKPIEPLTYILINIETEHWTFIYWIYNLYSRLSRCSTVRGSNFGLSIGSPAKVKAYKPFLFNESSLKVENKVSVTIKVELQQILFVYPIVNIDKCVIDLWSKL